MSEFPLLLFCFVLMTLILCIIGLYLTYKIEKKQYNNGICPKCGRPLYYCRNIIDQQQGRTYICKNCGYRTYIAYKSVDKPDSFL